ncbi:MAG: translation initiation factor IF-3 [Candidatus Coatesbacteria bacterium]|nr:translation initiation factor IF-3 [Candidatus Coatesbacteria bacterium]
MPIEQARERVNEAIRASEVRVIGQDGKQLGIMPTRMALQKAFDRNMDLVEVDPRGDPPVCKIMNYGKHKYETSKKFQGAKKSQVKASVKEVKFRPRTERHDFDFKIKHITRFLTSGHKVKVSVWFRGREKLHVEQGNELLDRVIEEIGDIAVVNEKPKFEGRNLSAILSPRKKAKIKKAEVPVEESPVEAEKIEDAS